MYCNNLEKLELIKVKKLLFTEFDSYPKLNFNGII